MYFNSNTPYYSGMNTKSLHSSIASIAYLSLLLSLLASPLPCNSETLKTTPETASIRKTILSPNDPPIDISTQKYTELFEELEIEHGFTRKELSELFTGLYIDHRVLDLIDNRRGSKPFFTYIALLFTPAVVEEGRNQLAEHRELLNQIEETFGVDREYIVAIWAIETRFGQNKGKHNVFRTLNTLFDAYPRRSAFFRKQLKHFLLLCRENGIEPRKVSGSYAGALGQAQFIPSSFREYAVSFDGDSKRDVFTSVPDILASIANYLKRHHWTLDGPVFADLGKKLKSEILVKEYLKGKKGQLPWQQLSTLQGINLPQPPDGKPLTLISLEVNPLLGGGKRYFAAYTNFRAITAWNHSNRYAMAVSQLALAISR